ERHVVRKVLANTALVVAAVVVGIGLVELGLRVVGISYPDFYAFDPDIGPVHAPNMRGWFTMEGRSYVSINSDGLRDREHTVAKPKDTIRIATLGDSFTEAFQIPAEDAYWSVLQRRLEACPRLHGKHVEVLNFGVGGYGATQEYLTLKHR